MSKHNHEPHYNNTGNWLIRRAKLIAGVAALGIVTGLAGWGINENAKAERETHRQEQMALERVIEPQMQDMAAKALALVKEHPNDPKFSIKSAGDKLVEIEASEWNIDKPLGISDHKEVDVVVRANEDGTPNTEEPIFVGLQTYIKVGALDTLHQIAYTGPGGEEFANEKGYRYDDHGEGWSAIDTVVKSQDNRMIIGLSGTVDSAEPRQFVTDHQGNVTDALTTAQSVTPRANDLFDRVAADLAKLPTIG